MRSSRIKADGAGYYHCMSRIIERRMILEDNEKERLLTLMRALAAFGGLEILSYTFLSNHFHILTHVPERQDISDTELIRRLHFIYTGAEPSQESKRRRHDANSILGANAKLERIRLPSPPLDLEEAWGDGLGSWVFILADWRWRLRLWLDWAS